jgi:hypothetical protein
MIEDLFKAYYHQDMKIAMHKNMYWWHSMFSDLVNFLMRLTTQGKMYNSMVVTKKIVEKMSEVLRDNNQWKSMTKKENKEMQDAQKNGQPHQESAEFKKLKQDMQSGMQEAMTEAKQEINEREELLDAMFGNGQGLNKQDDLKLSVKSLKERLGRLGKIEVDYKQLSNFVKSTLKTMSNSLGSNPTPIEESILDADEINDVLEMEYLPHLSLLEDISVMDVKYSTKYDIYIDISGSMNNHIYFGEKRIRRIHLASVIGWYIYKAGLCNDVYTFNSNLHSIEPEDVLNLETRGGTDFNAVSTNAIAVNRPALIITDGASSFSEYTDKVFLLNIDGYFSHSGRIHRKMIKKRQVSTYDHTGKIVIEKLEHEEV